MHLDELDTPAAWIDLKVMEHNLERMAGYAREHELSLRPHIKTHKVPELAKRQVAMGAGGITSAKVSEALVMARAGLDDILLAYPIWGKVKWERLRELASLARVTVATDSYAHAGALAEALGPDRGRINLLVEVDVGTGRCGLRIDENLPGEISKIVSTGIPLAGMMYYPGHIRSALGSGFEELKNRVAAGIGAFLEAGVRPAVVSGGSTPTWAQSHEITGMTEIRPGTYIFNDCNTVFTGAMGWEDCALKVRCRVVSTSVPGRAIIDGGSKTFSDAASLAGRGFGRLAQAPEVLCEKMNEEHGYLALGDSGFSPRPGDLVDVIPNHVCTTVNMHHTLYGIRDGRVEESWPVAARGMLQ